MSDVAELYRQRARFIERQITATDDMVVRVFRQQLAASYEQLAENEEWLSGEMSPNPVSGGTDTHRADA
jgi:hypothetical protein